MSSGNLRIPLCLRLLVKEKQGRLSHTKSFRIGVAIDQ